MRGQIISIQVAMPEQFAGVDNEDDARGPWTSGIAKRPVAGPVRVGRMNLEGDGQADRVNHGGPDKAVLAYSADHYPLWQSELPHLTLNPGAFGENLTVRGVTEGNVCIGDLWQADEAVFEVSQPRQPCWKLARRWNQSDLPKRVTQTGRSGWYLRVVNEGLLRPHSELALVDRRHPEWTVMRVAAAMYSKQPDPADLDALAELAELSASWREEFKVARESGPRRPLP